MAELPELKSSIGTMTGFGDTSKPQLVSRTIPNSAESSIDDDEWLDWETRKDSVPFWKHVIAGK